MNQGVVSWIPDVLFVWRHTQVSSHITACSDIIKRQSGGILAVFNHWQLPEASEFEWASEALTAHRFHVNIKYVFSQFIRNKHHISKSFPSYLLFIFQKAFLLWERTDGIWIISLEDMKQKIQILGDESKLSGSRVTFYKQWCPRSSLNSSKTVAVNLWNISANSAASCWNKILL